MTNLLSKIVSFYIDGFRAMKLGKKLWIIIIVKLFILFVVIKWLFFPNVLEKNFTNDKQRSEYILNQLTGE
jgi:flagellar basal body-associated protein FliL